MTTPDSITLHDVQTGLRYNLPFFAIATIVFVAGISSLLLALLRSRDRLLLWLGVLSIVYASRLFLQNRLFQGAMDAGEFLFLRLCLTYVIAIPYAAFARELLGPGWKRSITIWLSIQIAFALVVIPISAYNNGLWNWTDSANSVLVISGTLLILLHVILRPRNSESFAGTLTWPLVIFSLMVLLNNRGYRLAGMDVEPVGFLILLAGLGYTAARTAFARERKLTEVEQELTTARRIQNSIIPNSSPDFPGLLFASRYQPMTAVAGDFFDFLKTGESALTILVADVSGHGVPAALVASMLKVCFAAQLERAHNPAEVLTGLNAMLRGSLGGQYITASCAAIDLAGRTITYAGAGHPPGLLLRRSTGEVTQLAENGLFIGPFPLATYSNLSVPFGSGDKLLLYTDGILEATGPDGQEFGQKSLEQLFLKTHDLEPAVFIEQLFRMISTPMQQDDLTAVVAQFG